jgi:hypothetical protein
MPGPAASSRDKRFRFCDSDPYQTEDLSLTLDEEKRILNRSIGKLVDAGGPTPHAGPEKAEQLLPYLLPAQILRVGFAIHTGFLPSRHGKSCFGRLGIPLYSGRSGRGLTSVPLSPGVFGFRHERCRVRRGNMKYVRPSIGRNRRFPLPCANGEQARLTRSRSPNCELCGRETRTSE